MKKGTKIHDIKKKNNKKNPQTIMLSYAIVYRCTVV